MPHLIILTPMELAHTK